MPILDLPVNNPEIALFYVNLLRQLRGPNPHDNIASAVTADLGQYHFGRYYPPTELGLGFWFGGTNTRSLLLIDGVRTQSQSTHLLLGYQHLAGVGVIQGNNTWMNDRATEIFNRIGANNFFISEHLDFAGYSAGGAVATAMVAGILTREFRPKMKLSTFGAPRTGHQNIRDGMSNLPIARWMTSGDPIPLVPLRLQDAPSIAAIVPWTIILSWSNFIHSRGGISIAPNGVTTDSVLPTEASAAPVTSVASWLWGIEDDPTNPHSLVSYYNALTAAVAATQTPQQVELEVAGGEHVNRVERREANRERQQIEDAIFTRASEQTAENIVTPAITLFQAFRQGRVWYVRFGDQVVIIAGPEKRARHIARAGNDFCRSLQKQAVVSPETLLGQMSAFLAQAQDPAGLFRPPINTTIPD